MDVAEVGDVNPHAKAWTAVHPHSDLIPVARANGLTMVLTMPSGGLISGQSALVRLIGTTPAALTVKAPVAMHFNYPTGQPTLDPARMTTEEQERQETFQERERERKRNQEKELNRLRNLLEEAKAYGAALEAARAGKIPTPKVDLPMEALAPVARGEMPAIFRVDSEEDIRGAVKFSEERGLKLILGGGLEAWKCADLLRAKNVPVLLKVNRLPRRESDPYDAAYSNAAELHKARVAFAIVTDDASNARNLPYEAAMARAYGLPADQAIRAITLSPAQILGVASRMGSIAVGKDANLVVTTGDIMDPRTQVTRVYIDGVACSLETRHTQLYQQFRYRK
jgi:imidazolonepropionase-like amidohydrolase